MQETKIPSSEALIAYCARVSNPSGQDRFDKDEGLLQYCMKNKHWSIFEMANAVVEVESTRDITRQLLRHRSLSFQEFSQRYSDEIEFTDREFRGQDLKNRQNSLDNLTEGLKDTLTATTSALAISIKNMYNVMRELGVAKECARVVLPEGMTMSRLYVNGTLRSWLHYLEVRDDPGVTQHEHVVLAKAIRDCLAPAFPKIFNLKDI